MKIIKAIYNFIVGDMIILIGVLLAIVIVALIEQAVMHTSLNIIGGILLILAVLIVLVATLSREAFSKR